MKIRNLGFSKEDFKLVKNYMGMIILGFLIVVQCIYLRAEQKFVLATTLDFTGWGWWDEKDRHPDYYPLEILETRIKELAEVGIGKIYLRVSVRGLSLYPSKVTKQYGEDDLFHWQDPQRSRRLIATLQKYDPCREIIRLGHKYGMQVWAWESIFEDGGMNFFIPKDEKYMKLAERMRFDAMSNPAFIDHPEYFIMRDPKLNDSIDDATLKIEEKKCLQYPIKKIEIVGRDKRDPLRFSEKDVVIMTSSNNRVYSEYMGKRRYECGVNCGGLNYITIDDLDITSPYVMLKLKNDYPKDIAQVTMSVTHESGICRVLNSNNEEVTVSWGMSYERDFPLNFVKRKTYDWDYRARGIGFHVTKYPEANVFIFGVAELCVPAVKKHKVERFHELAKYPFDGFMLNFRSHCHYKADDFKNYAYNPAVRVKVLEQFGKDIWKEKVEERLVDSVRGEAFANFLESCKALTGQRPLYLSGLPPASWPEDDNLLHGRQHNMKMYWGFKSYPIPYERLFADGSIDGINMVGADFSDYLKDKKSNGRQVRIGVFREGNLLLYPPYAGYNLLDEINEIKQSGKYDEVELYEAAYLTPMFGKKNLGEIRAIMMDGSKSREKLMNGGVRESK